MSCALLSLLALLAHCFGREGQSFDRVLNICRLDVGYASMCAAVHFVGLCGSKLRCRGPRLCRESSACVRAGQASRIDLPCRSTASVRADTCRRMAAEHLADEEMRLHPLYSCCATIMASSEGREALEELMLPHLHIVKHVAVYVVTTGRMGVIRVLKKKKQARSWTAFGGCNYLDNVLLRLNSLRLELIDEAALNLKRCNVVSFSPLCIRGDTLLQVVLVSQKWVDQAALWCPESVRSIHADLPHDSGTRSLPAHLDTRPLRT